MAQRQIAEGGESVAIKRDEHRLAAILDIDHVCVCQSVTSAESIPRGTGMHTRNKLQGTYIVQGKIRTQYVLIISIPWYINIFNPFLFFI